MRGSSSTTGRRTEHRRSCANSVAPTTGSDSLSIPSDANPVRGRSSVRAFNAGVMGEPTHADLVTGLDADVSFGPEYFDSLRQRVPEEFAARHRFRFVLRASRRRLGACSCDPSKSARSLPHVPQGMPRAATAAGRALRLGRDSRCPGRYSRLGNSDSSRISPTFIIAPPALAMSAGSRATQKTVTRPTTCGTGPPTCSCGRCTVQLVVAIPRPQVSLGLRTLSSGSEAEASRGRLSRVRSFKSVAHELAVPGSRGHGSAVTDPGLSLHGEEVRPPAVWV